MCSLRQRAEREVVRPAARQLEPVERLLRVRSTPSCLLLTGCPPLETKMPSSVGTGPGLDGEVFQRRMVRRRPRLMLRLQEVSEVG